MDNINVNGLMITVGIEQRGNLIKKSVQNFFDQDYPFKVLHVLNQGKESIKELFPNCSIKEYFTKTIGITNLRNELLNKIDWGEICVQWDDDDLKPINYIATLHEIIIREKCDGVISKGVHFYDNNVNKISLLNSRLGAPNSFFFKKNNIIYKGESVGEDVGFATKYVHKHNVCFIDLPIIKIVHNNNVSERRKGESIYDKDILEHEYGNWFE